jgi:hypothetical protein
MKQTLINNVVQGMLPYLDNGQIEENGVRVFAARTPFLHGKGAAS